MGGLRSKIGGVVKKAKKVTGFEALHTVLQEGLSQAGVGGVSPLEERKKRKIARETGEYESAKAAARKRIKPIPDVEAGKVARRKAAGKKRAERGGRTSTILSAPDDTLG